MTHCTDLGYEVGDVFRVIGNRSGFTDGQVVTLYCDDETGSPIFAGDNDMFYCADGEGGAFLSLTNVEKVAPQDVPDWSKAPKGATHYNGNCPYPWLKQDKEYVSYFRSNRWGRYGNQDEGRTHVASAIPRPKQENEMFKTELTQRIENLQSEIDALKAKAAKHQEPTIDWSKMIGLTVETRDYYSQEWKRRVLLGHNPDSRIPFNCDAAWKQCRLYEGPTQPNWIEWHGGKCPVNGATFVLVQFRNEDLMCRKAKDFQGWRHENRPGDIVNYTEIQYKP